MNVTTSTPPRPDPPARVHAWQFAVSIAVGVALHLPALFRTAALNSDEATIGTMARVMRHGGRLYRDAVDRKPPAAFVLDRWLDPLFGSATLAAGRWVALTLLIGALWILAMEARRRWPDTTPLAVVVVGLVAFSALPAEDSRAMGFEMLGVAPMVLAFVLGARGRTTLAGFALGAAALCKQPMLFGAAALAAQCWIATSPAPAMKHARWMRAAGRLAAAGAITAATVAAGLAPFGFSDALAWFAGSGDNYLGGITLAKVAAVSVGQIGLFLALTMGLIILAVVAWREHRPSLDVIVWTVGAILAVAIGFRFLLHYFIQVLPPMLLLAAPMLRRPLIGIGRSERVTRGLAAAWLVGAAVFGMITTLTPTSFHDLPELDAVAAAVRERTEPGDRIFVWGQAPEIYWLSERDPATRYPHVGFITGITPKRDVPAYTLAQPDAAANLLDDLERTPPVVIVDAAVASVRGGDRYPLATSPVADFVDANYCETTTFGSIRLLERCAR